MMRPLAADVAEKLGVEFSYVDIEAEGNDDFVNDISGIQSIPTFILYVDGVESNRAVGRMSQATLEEFLS
jgi:thiol-disulfide isomerase/thioredoxin